MTILTLIAYATAASRPDPGHLNSSTIAQSICTASVRTADRHSKFRPVALLFSLRFGLTALLTCPVCGYRAVMNFIDDN
jgi:hypothetical protein